jgi:glycosyltransferase involved in cell wall biosynthesis
MQLITLDRGGPIDHAVDVACELARRQHDSHLVGPAAQFADRLAAAGVQWHDVTVGHKTDLPGLRKVLQVLADVRPTVLHCQDRRAGMIGRLAGRWLSIPGLVYTVHGVPDGLSDLVAGNARAATRRRRDGLYYLRGERWLAGLVPARIVTPSEAVRDYLLEHVRITAAAVDVVPNGVDPTRFRPGLTEPSRNVTALWLGLMTPVKRVDLLVRAAAGVPELRLLLVGAGPEHAAVSRSIQSAGMSARTTVRSYTADPPALFSEADVFALPSAAESCPLAVLQAMACGLPIVATHVGGVPELVRSEVDGILVPPRNTPTALTHALARLVEDPQLRRRMGASARERAVSAFTLGACVERLLAVYERAVG